jgi:hypothetical protein
LERSNNFKQERPKKITKSIWQISPTRSKQQKELSIFLSKITLKKKMSKR